MDRAASLRLPALVTAKKMSAWQPGAMDLSMPVQGGEYVLLPLGPYRPDIQFLC